MVVAVGGSHRDHVVAGVAGRVHRVGVVVGPVIAGRSHDDHTVVAGVVDRGRHRRVVPAARVAVVDYLRAVGDRVIQGADGIAQVAAAARVEELEGHNLDVPVDAGHADAVVPD